MWNGLFVHNILCVEWLLDNVTFCIKMCGMAFFKKSSPTQNGIFQKFGDKRGTVLLPRVAPRGNHTPNVLFKVPPAILVHSSVNVLYVSTRFRMVWKDFLDEQ